MLLTYISWLIDFVKFTPSFIESGIKVYFSVGSVSMNLYRTGMIRSTAGVGTVDIHMYYGNNVVTDDCMKHRNLTWTCTTQVPT